MGLLGSLGITPRQLITKGLGKVSPILGQVAGMMGRGGGGGGMMRGGGGGGMQPQQQQMINMNTDPVQMRAQNEQNQLMQSLMPMLQQQEQQQDPFQFQQNPYQDIRNVFQQRFGRM